MKPALGIIDIGSNSVRLMIAAAEECSVRAISKTLCTTRLAKGIDQTRCLSEDRVADTVAAIARYKAQTDAHGIPVIAYATSAVRDAENRDAFVARVKAQTGVSVRVLSGEQEGSFAFSAVTGGEGTVFDIGGGSFQIVTRERSVSFPCGCVRAKEQCDVPQPSVLRDRLFAWIDAHAEMPGSVPPPVYGVGGTITTISALITGMTAYDPTRLKPIALSELLSLTEVLCAIPEPTRMEHPLLLRRGDVILQGATILRYMMERTHTDCVIPSDRDGMEGIAEAFLKDGTFTLKSDGSVLYDE